MESTGVYWKPVYNILEDFFDITLANAQRINNVPGRKTDVFGDAEWIATLIKDNGLIEKSFVPPEDRFEIMRDLTRLRKKWIGHMTSEKNPNPKVLEFLKHQIKHSYFRYILEYQTKTIGTTDE